jgi:GTPase
MIFNNIENLKYNIEIETGLIPKQPKENFYGNREYKLKIINCPDNKIIKRSTQMLFRLHEGNGKAIYLIGIDDNGNIEGLTLNEMNISLNNIIKITEKTECKIKKIKIYQFIKSDKINNHKLNKFIIIIRLIKDLDCIYI